MGEQARVRSLEALRRVRAALIRFDEEARACISNVESEIQRVTSWLELERPLHFKREIRRREDLVEGARKEISRKQLIRAPEPASVVLERKVLRREQEALERCRTRLRALKVWTPQWQKEADLYRSAVAPLNDALYREIPAAVEQLDRMMDAIEGYWAIAAPETARVDEVTAALGGPAAGSGSEALPMRPREERIAKLRGWAPEPGVRRHMTVRGMPRQDWTTPPLRESDRIAVDRMGEAAVGREDIIVIASVGVTAMELFLVRGEPAERDGGGVDSGWYIGNAEHPDRTGGDIAVRVGELLAARPDLAELLTLPVGSLAVLGGGVLSAVLDADDRNIWKGSSL